MVMNFKDIESDLFGFSICMCGCFCVKFVCNSSLSHKRTPSIMSALNLEPLPTLVYMSITWIARKIDTWLVGMDKCWMDITYLWYLLNKDIQLGLSLNIGYHLFFKIQIFGSDIIFEFFLFDQIINVSNINHYLLIKYHYQISYTPIAHILWKNII